MVYGYRRVSARIRARDGNSPQVQERLLKRMGQRKVHGRTDRDRSTQSGTFLQTGNETDRDFKIHAHSCKK